MKRLLLFSLLILPTFISAQQLKKITEGDKYEKSVYYVLKSDPKIKHGNYQLYKFNELKTNGYYKNGLMDSVWTEYNPHAKEKEIISIGNYKEGKKNGLWTEYYSNRKKESEGHYLEDEKVGLWEFYTSTGEKEQAYDYTSKQLVYVKSFKSDEKFKAIVGSDTILTTLERPAVYIGSKKLLMQFIGKNIRYPEHAMENKISGKVYISFMIDPKGKAFGHKVKKGFYAPCDQEALRVVKLVPNNWVPAILDGKPVTVEFEIPINFVIH